MRKKKFDFNAFPMTFYAHMMQFIERDAYNMRCVLNFEAVEKDSIQMFISGELPERLTQTTQDAAYFEQVWGHFSEGGLSGRQFVANKAMYLAQVSNAEIDLMLCSFAVAKGIAEAENDWWEITIYPASGEGSEDMDACMVAFPDVEWTEAEFPFTLRAVSKEEQERLYHLYTHYEDDWLQNNREGGTFGAFGPATTFGEVQPIYVGAALCCRLTDTAGNAVGYFDLGFETHYSRSILRRRNPANYQAMGVMADNLHQAVLNDVRNAPNSSIIISHWHVDHVSILNEMALDYMNNGNYAPFWQNAEFFFPQILARRSWGVTYFTNVRGAFMRAGNPNVHMAPYRNATQNTHFYGQTNIDIYKCDRNDSAIRNPNPHNHGISAVITLNSGRKAFLAGDCTYDTVGADNVNAAELTNAGAGYDYLMVSHHGGVYSHTAAAGRWQYIPRPSVGGVAVYSANGAAYGHPVAANVAAYAGRGWTNIAVAVLAQNGLLRLI